MFPFTLQQLRMLKALATEKSFTKAAKSLYLSQPSISKQIKTLEKNINLKLLSRETHQISLTENGKIVLEYAERILALSEECCRNLIDLQTSERGKLTIATTPYLHQYFLSKVLDLFATNYPQINLEVRIQSNSLTWNLLQKNQVEIGFVTAKDSTKYRKDIWVKPFVTDEICVIVSNFIRPTLTSFQPFFRISQPLFLQEELLDFNLITLPSNANYQKLIDTTLLSHQIDIKRFPRSFQLTSIESIKFAVSLGLGVAFLPFSSLGNELKWKRIKILPLSKITLNEPILMLHHSQCLRTQAFQIFWRELNRLISSCQIEM